MADAKSSTEVLQQLEDALTDCGLHVSTVLFDSSKIPDTVKDRSFRIVPGSIEPVVATANSISATIAFRVFVAYAATKQRELDAAKLAILPDLDRILPKLVALDAWEAPLEVRVDTDMESGRYLSLELGVHMAYCLERSQ